MAQTLIRFDTPVIHRDGRQYRAQACGRELENGQWEAWLEFEDMTSGEILRSQRETTQPNQKDAVYWATGLTPVYLEGALDRILHPPKYKAAEPVRPPFFDGPAPRRRAVVSNREPIFDPFSVYREKPGFARAGADGPARAAPAPNHQGFRSRRRTRRAARVADRARARIAHHAAGARATSVAVR